MTRDYIGGIEYVNDTLDAIYHSEGRIKYIDEVARYEYHIRDHLGNKRLSYSDLNGRNSPDDYRFPENIFDFEKANRIIDKSLLSEAIVLLNKDKSETRISSRILVICDGSITVLGERIDQWASTNLDTSEVQITRTGTGLILTKNAAHVRNSLFSGLVLAIPAVIVVMRLLFVSWRILLIAILPNLFPLL